MHTYYDTDLQEARTNRMYQSARYDEWKKMRETEQKLYIAVVKAWRKNKTEGRWSQSEELGEWITREQIADELGFERLIPYYLKLLAHLSGGKNSRDYEALHWLQRTKRPRWRQTYEGRKRPAGYEWVYYPREDVIEALNAMNPNNPDNQKREAARPAAPALPPAPKYQLPWWERALDKVLDLLP